MVGQTVGKYQVVSRLGRGGMGTVYTAVDATLERQVAITARTKTLFIPLRVPEEDLHTLTTELEARTGSRVVTPK